MAVEKQKGGKLSFHVGSLFHCENMFSVFQNQRKRKRMKMLQQPKHGSKTKIRPQNWNSSSRLCSLAITLFFLFSVLGCSLIPDSLSLPRSFFSSSSFSRIARNPQPGSHYSSQSEGQFFPSFLSPSLFPFKFLMREKKKRENAPAEGREEEEANRLD